MTIAGRIGLDHAPMTRRGLTDWIDQVATLTDPAAVVWCDGSDAQRVRLADSLVNAGTFVRQEMEPGSFRCAVDLDDLAEVGRHTYVCTPSASASRRFTRWMDPLDMSIILTEECRGCMSGRTMYVVPFSLDGSATADQTRAVQITDSEYVVVALHLAAGDHEIGPIDFDDDTEMVRCLHSVGAPRRVGQADVRWPCDRTKYTAVFPETHTIWSYGSGFASNPLLGGLDQVGGAPSRSDDGASPAGQSSARRNEIAVVEAWLGGS